MQKEPDAFRTISEVADELDVPQHVLRFWETRFSQVRPMKRAGGRRYYRPQDVDLLRGIRRLLYDEGYTIKGVQKILRQHGVAHVIAVGRGELAVIPAAALAAGLPQQPADAPARETAAKGGASAGASVTALRKPSASANGGAADATTLRRELSAALRELEEARSLLLQALGEDHPDDADDNGARRHSGAV